MKTVNTLIKMRQGVLEEKRRVLMRLEQELVDLAQEEKETYQEMEKEKAMAEQNMNLRKAWRDYVTRQEARLRRLEQEMADISQAADNARENVRLAHVDVKILEEYKLLEEKKAEEKAKKLELKRLDEVATQTYRRKIKN